MLKSRRRFLKGLGSFAFSASGAIVLSGCNTLSLQPERQKVALLLPLTGRASQIGGGLRQAANLALPKDDPFVDLMVLDTGSDAPGAGIAAQKAVRRGAKLILGPVFRDGTRAAVRAVNGGVPVVAFTNDTTLSSEGAFVFGLTPAQSVSSILGYAKSKGLTRIAVVKQAGEGSRQAAEAARRLAGQNGMKVTAVIDGGTASVAANVRSQSGGSLPDAVLLPGGGAAMIRDAEAIGKSGVQLLGTEQWLDTDLKGHSVFEGAWFAAPVPPDRFMTAFKQQAATPGLLSGLVYDAVNMARVLAASGEISVNGLTRDRGFAGALGRFTFRADRTCERSLSILTVKEGREQVLASGES